MNVRHVVATISAALIAVPQSLVPLGGTAAAVAGAAMLPGLAQAESGKRVCSYFWGFYAGNPKIGFATKVNKGANGTCSDKLGYMASRMSAMGGPKGVGSYVATYNISLNTSGGQYFTQVMQTCENFAAYPYGQPGSDPCASMTTNYVYAFAAWSSGKRQLRYYAN